jgi:hypothetical protein
MRNGWYFFAFIASLEVVLKGWVQFSEIMDYAKHETKIHATKGVSEC